MFHLDDGIKLTAIDLALDVVRRQPRGYISHAHADHSGRHALALCTSQTAELYRYRFGDRPVREMEYRRPLEWGPLRLTAYPAGHVLGSSMLLVEGEGYRLLYTGDFHGQSLATAEAAEFPRADVLIMECTFGEPQYVWPSRQALVEQLLQIITTVRSRGLVPVIHAYTLGKAQELTRLLSERQVGVLQHPLIYETSRVYERLGCSLGDYSRYGPEFPGDLLREWEDRAAPFVLLWPPRTQKAADVELPERIARIAVTGWASGPAAKYRLNVDYALPLSDHAGYTELLACVQLVQPELIFCTHGSPAFAEDLRRRGHEAHFLTPETARLIWRFRPTARPFSV